MQSHACACMYVLCVYCFGCVSVFVSVSMSEGQRTMSDICLHLPPYLRYNISCLLLKHIASCSKDFSLVFLYLPPMIL